MGLGNPDLERRIKAGETLTREEALEVWDDVKHGIRKTFPHGFLVSQEHRENIGKTFVSEFRFNKPINEFNNWRYPCKTDFADAKLAGLLLHYYASSPYLLFMDIGLTNPTNPNYDGLLDKMPWLALEVLPNGYWADKKNRINATTWLVETLLHLGRKIEDIISDDFRINYLSNIIDRTGSAYAALTEAGYDIDLTQMRRVPTGYWDVRENRARCVMVRTEELGRRPTEEDLPSRLVLLAGGIRTAREEAKQAEKGLLNQAEEK